MSDGNGSMQGSSGTQAFLVGYGVLQLTTAASLVAVWVVLVFLVRQFLPGADDFNTSWAAAFLVVPVGFLPVLVWWQGWAIRRYGRHPRLWRLAAELAFAVDVVGCLVLRGLA